MDRRTLFTVQASLLIFLAAVLLAAYYSQAEERRDRGSPWFAAAFYCAGIGLLLQSYRDIIPPFFSILLGNGIFLLFGPLGNRAAARTTGQKRDHMVLLLLLDLATVLNFAYYTYWQPNVLLRTLEAVPVLGVMSIATMSVLARNTDRVTRPATRAMIAIYCLHLAPGFIRIAIAWKFKVPDAAFTWAGIITIAGLALSYLWIGSLRTQEELRRTAMTDPLTGLFNRRALDMVALPTLESAKRHQLPCSALMLDVDRFKQINDRLGHAAGDASLRAVADALHTTLRVTDIGTRIGGDEFFALLPDCDEAQADGIVSRLYSSIAELELRTVSGEPFHIAVSIGRITLRGDDLSLAEMLHASDIMLYREKQKVRANDVAAAVAAQPGTVPAGSMLRAHLNLQGHSRSS